MASEKQSYLDFFKTTKYTWNFLKDDLRRWGYLDAQLVAVQNTDMRAFMMSQDVATRRFYLDFDLRGIEEEFIYVSYLNIS